MDKLREALDLCNRKEFDKALTILEEYVKTHPSESEAWRVLAQIHWLHLQQPEKALDELIEALKCDPKNIWALVLMGNLFTKVHRDYDNAKKYYDKVLEYYPDNAIAINNIGATFMDTKDYERALPYFEKVIKLDSTYTNSYYGLALCYDKLNMHKECFETCHEGALKSVDRPENPQVREELIKLFLVAAKKYAANINYSNVWKGIKDELEAVDHTNIRISEEHDMNVLAKLEYAPLHAAKEHVIRYNPEKDFVEHLFIHEMMHLKLFQLSRKNGIKKVVICSNGTRAAFSKRFGGYMRKKHSNIGTSELHKIESQMADAMGLQLMNSPLDLFVEHMIYSGYMIARPIQMLSLFQMESDNIKSVREASSSGFFPKEVVYANKVMNIVSCMHFMDMYGINLVGQYNPTKLEYAHAKDLYEEFKAYWKTHKDGDEYEMMEYFVQSFNMEDFIEIITEEQLTSSMKADISMVGFKMDSANKAPSTEYVEEANAQFAREHKDGADPTETMMMSMYMLGAMEYMDTLERHEVSQLAIEIALVGTTGINPKNKYTLKSIPDKEFGGYELLAYYYVSWARAYPEKIADLGLPFSQAYEAAVQMYNAKRGKQ